MWARVYRNVDDLRDAVAAFVELYNTKWLIERLGHRTPRETYQDWLADRAAARAIVNRTVQGTGSGSHGR